MSRPSSRISGFILAAIIVCIAVEATVLLRGARMLRERQTGREITTTTSRATEASGRPAPAAPERSAPLSPEDKRVVDEMSDWLDRADKIKRLFATKPELGTPELAMLSDEDWFLLGQETSLETEAQIAEVTAKARLRAENLAVMRMRSSLRSYLSSHNNHLPQRVTELADYCTPPIAPEVFARFTLPAPGTAVDVKSRSRADLIVKAAPIDNERDRVWHVTLSGSSSEPAANYSVREAQSAFRKDHGGVDAATADELAPYLRWPVRRDLVEKRVSAATKGGK